jgi:ornithine cyclodeaminase/alanine dehydrogenase-like protein (mu-crystallin family)
VTLILSNEDIDAIVTMPECIKALEEAYAKHAAGRDLLTDWFTEDIHP